MKHYLALALACVSCAVVFLMLAICCYREYQHGLEWVEMPQPGRMLKGVEFKVDWPAGYDSAEMLRWLKGSDLDSPRVVVPPEGTVIWIRRRDLRRVVTDPVKLANYAKATQ